MRLVVATVLCGGAHTTTLTPAHGQLLAAVARGEVETVPGGLVLLDGMAPGRPRIDAVFLDIMMQRSNGEDVCQRLRAAGILTPIVAATGNGMKVSAVGSGAAPSPQY